VTRNNTAYALHLRHFYRAYWPGILGVCPDGDLNEVNCSGTFVILMQKLITSRKSLGFCDYANLVELELGDTSTMSKTSFEGIWPREIEAALARYEHVPRSAVRRRVSDQHEFLLLNWKSWSLRYAVSVDFILGTLLDYFRRIRRQRPGDVSLGSFRS
jgi:hypothetical protein